MKRWILILTVILVLAGGAGFYWLREHTSSQRVSGMSNEPPQPRVEAVTSRWLVMGDVFWARSMHKWSMASELRYAYPFSGLASFGREDYQAWIANLECPVTDKGVNQAEQANLLKFNCPPEYLGEAAKWFSAFSLANNHTDNQGGLSGLEQTRQYLEQSGIQYFGHYDASRKEELCEVLSLPVKLRYDDQTVKDGRLPVAFCGFHTVFRLATDQEIQTVSRYAASLPTFVMSHSGAEYKATRDTMKERQFRAMIDAGATAVFGAHPHWVQDSEAYKGKLIVYSQGNFIFDQQFEPDVRRGAVIDVNLTFRVGEDQLEDWLAIGETCQKFQDDCLGQIEQRSLGKLETSVVYDVLASDSGNKLTKQGDAALLSAVKERLRWETTLSQLKSYNEAQ